MTRIRRTREERPRWRRILPAAALIGMTILAYLHALRNGWIWDDDKYVTQNSTLASLRGLGRIWVDPAATPQYYPAVYTTFWLERRVFGLNPAGYHLVNVLLHGVNAALLWLLLRRLGLPGAFLAGAIFALHPVQVESVAWVTERKNVLSALFYLLALLAWLRHRGQAARPGLKSSWRMYGSSLALFALAMLTDQYAARFLTKSAHCVGGPELHRPCPVACIGHHCVWRRITCENVLVKYVKVLVRFRKWIHGSVFSH